MKIPSQMYAVIFLLIGVGVLILADHSHNADVVKAMIACGTGLITGAAVAYQHKPDWTETAEEPQQKSDGIK